MEITHAKMIMMVNAKNNGTNSRQYLRAPSWQSPEENDKAY
jgi:hypothetical protein